MGNREVSYIFAISTGKRTSSDRPIAGEKPTITNHGKPTSDHFCWSNPSETLVIISHNPVPDRFGVGDYLLRIDFSSSSKLTPATLGDRLWSEKAMVRSIAFLLTFVALAFPALADEGHHHDDLSEQQFGSVHFPTSCNPKVQKNFERGVALLHSFAFETAEATFRQVAQDDPHCAMAHWGVAKTFSRWGTPNPKQLQHGWEEINIAKSLRAKTARERSYIAAQAALYAHPEKKDEKREQKYLKAMEALYRHYPGDHEGAAFYAFALNDSDRDDDPTHANRKAAAAILEKLFLLEPNHPGVAHYLVHTYDCPGMAELGLPAARRYAQIAPAAPHALHMPSHIFARLGMWQEDIASNLASLAAAKRAASGTESRLHAMDFLEYAYLQTAQDSEAKAIEGEAVALKNEGFTRGMELYYYYSQSHFPALLLLETKNWKAAESLQPAPNADRGSKAIIYRARAIGAGHIGDVIMAREAVRNLDEALPFIEESHPELMVPPVDANKNEAHAWLAFAEGNSSAAFDLLQQVIQFQDHVGKGEAER